MVSLAYAWIMVTAINHAEVEMTVSFAPLLFTGFWDLMIAFIAAYAYIQTHSN